LVFRPKEKMKEIEPAISKPVKIAFIIARKEIMW
jgi:hypothetical protein